MAKLGLDPDAEVEEYLTLAIESDPLYGEAYIARADYWLRQHKPDAAMEDAQEAEDLNLNLPIHTCIRRKLVALGEIEDSLPLARKSQPLRSYLG